MRISVIDGSDTTADPLVAIFVTIALLLIFEFVEQVVESIEALVPAPLVARDPVVNGFERSSVQPVHPLPPLLAHPHEPHLSEHAQVLRYLWLSELELRDEIVYRLLAAREHVEDLAPPRLGDGVERIGCGSG